MIRLTHWVGVVCVTVLLLSGLQIFNAHPALYLGQASDFAQPIASIGAEQKEARQIGVTNILGYSFDTTGFLGLSGPANEEQHAFPFWLTLPGYQDLATGRRWHFFFAWLLVS
jgi:thiosulfate reductase cytochrome b subunit